MFHPNDYLINPQLNAVKSALDGGFIFVFAGPVPAGPDAALNMATTHTQVAMFSVDGDGVTGLTFDTPAGSPLQKDPSELWKGVIAFDGVDDGESTLTPSFWRFCPSGDDGRGAGSGPRLQGTCGGPSSSADMRFMASTVTANGSNELGVAVFDYSLNLLG